MKSKYDKISKHEKFLNELLNFVNSQIKEFKYLHLGYSSVIFREVFQSLESIKSKIEKEKEK